MLILHLGVLDVPYKEDQVTVQKYGVTKISSITTGEVAEILEDEYHVMEIFFNLHEDFVAKSLEEGLAGTLEDLLTGAPPSKDPFGRGCSAIESRFKDFLSNREMDQLGYPGIPTGAAEAGVNHRLLHPYAKDNPERPSFIDTGQYQADFKSWVT